MTKPYSADLRERVVGAVEDGETRREARTASGSAQLLRFAGIRLGGKTAPSRPCPAVGAIRLWTTSPSR